MYAESEIIVVIADFSFAVLENNVGNGQLTAGILINLRFTILITVIQVVVFMVFEIRMIGTITARIAAGFAARLCPEHRPARLC